MNSDAFERFEKGRGGWLIPLTLFLVGAVATLIAIDTVMRVAVEQAPQLQDAPPKADAEMPRPLPAGSSADPQLRPDPQVGPDPEVRPDPPSGRAPTEP